MNIQQVSHLGLASLKPAVGILNPDLGVIKATPSRLAPSHHTLWLANGAEPWKIFQVIENKEKES
ncbi:MAG: hypothetical protein AB4290_03185 [Spirulina sp.]